MEIPESIKQRNILPVAKFQPLESLYNDDKHSADNGQASRKRKQLSNKRDHKRLSLLSIMGPAKWVLLIPCHGSLNGPASRC